MSYWSSLALQATSTSISIILALVRCLENAKERTIKPVDTRDYDCTPRHLLTYLASVMTSISSSINHS